MIEVSDRNYQAFYACWRVVENYLEDPSRIIPDASEDESRLGDDTEAVNSLSQAAEVLKASSSRGAIGNGSLSANNNVVPDDALEELNRRFADVLKSDGDHSFTPSALIVPKDFSMQLFMSVNHHLALLDEASRNEKYRRLLGYPTPARKGPTHGFDPSHLIKALSLSSLYSANPCLCTLDEEIHPLFKRENFHGCPDMIYDQLKPGLRLATVLLFHRATAKFWHRLEFGKREPCQITSRLASRPAWRVRESVCWTAEQAIRFREFLDKQSDSVYFFFHRTPLAETDIAYAATRLVYEYGQVTLPGTSDKRQKTKFCLHTDFYTTARRLSLLASPDPAMILRFNFFLAVIVCHEVAHFIEVAGPSLAAFGGTEIFFGDDQWAECGVAFEVQIFGGRILPISNRIDCAYGISVSDWPRRKLYDKEENRYYTIPMEYIWKIQQKDTWEQALTMDDPSSFLRIPRTWTFAREVNSVNMVIWKDEADDVISDEIEKAKDDPIKPLKRTFSGRIVKTGRQGSSSHTLLGSPVSSRNYAHARAVQAKQRRKENVEWRLKKSGMDILKTLTAKATRKPERN